MFKFVKSYKDGKKCESVLASCENFGHLTSAMNLIHNYGKMYNYDNKWVKMEKKGRAMWKEFADKLEYDKRLKELYEQKESVNSEGNCDGVTFDARV